MTQETTSPDATPSEQLAKRIGQKLLDAKLISTSKANEVIGKMTRGIATQADWKFWLEIPPEAETEVPK